MGTEVLGNDNDNIKFSNRPKEFWLTLISTIAAFVLSLFSWVKVDLQSGYFCMQGIYHTDMSFNLFSFWGKLNVFDDMIALSNVTDAIKATSMILSILMFVSLTLLIVFLIKFRSKRRAIFAYCGFGLMALVSLTFIEMPLIYNIHMVMTAFPFLTLVVSIIGILFNDKPNKTNNGLLQRVIIRVKENPEILFACVPFVLQ